jgi:hypothetical protein
VNERNYAHEEAVAWTHALHLLCDKLSLTRGYNVNDIPRADFHEIEEALQEWATANVRARMQVAS